MIAETIFFVLTIASLIFIAWRAEDKIKRLEKELEEVENKECPFIPPPPLMLPQEEAPEENRCQYYYYNYFGNGWYGRSFFCNPDVTYLRMSVAPPLRQWINIYPLPQDEVNYTNDIVSLNKNNNQ